MVDDFLRNDGLEKNFSIRSSKVFHDDFFSVFNRVGLFWVFILLSFLLLDIDHLLLNIFNWLNISFSISNLSGNFNRNLVDDLFVVDNRLVLDSFSIHRSRDFFLSDNWCLHHSLFNDRLRNDSFGNYWLRNYLSFDLRLTDNLLTLSNLWSGIKYFAS